MAQIRKLSLFERFLATAKMWAAFVGTITGVLLGFIAHDSALFPVLGAVAAVAAAVVAYHAPYRPIRRGRVHVRINLDDQMTGKLNGLDSEVRDAIAKHARDAALDYVEQEEAWRRAQERP